MVFSPGYAGPFGPFSSTPMRWSANEFPRSSVFVLPFIRHMSKLSHVSPGIPSQPSNCGASCSCPRSCWTAIRIAAAAPR